MSSSPAPLFLEYHFAEGPRRKAEERPPSDVAALTKRFELGEHRSSFEFLEKRAECGQLAGEISERIDLLQIPIPVRVYPLSLLYDEIARVVHDLPNVVADLSGTATTSDAESASDLYRRPPAARNAATGDVLRLLFMAMGIGEDAEPHSSLLLVDCLRGLLVWW